MTIHGKIESNTFSSPLTTPISAPSLYSPCFAIFKQDIDCNNIVKAVNSVAGSRWEEGFGTDFKPLAGSHIITSDDVLTVDKQHKIIQEFLSTGQYIPADSPLPLTELRSTILPSASATIFNIASKTASRQSYSPTKSYKMSTSGLYPYQTGGNTWEWYFPSISRERRIFPFSGVRNAINLNSVNMPLNTLMLQPRYGGSFGSATIHRELQIIIGQ